MRSTLNIGTEFVGFCTLQMQELLHSLQLWQVSAYPSIRLLTQSLGARKNPSKGARSEERCRTHPVASNLTNTYL
jgi:hypothetical protein